MSTNVGKKHIAHKGSGHGCVAPAAMSLVTPPAPPAPTPFPYTARASNASGTTSDFKIGGNEVLVEGSTMSLDPPANQPAQSGGGDVVTHATKNIAVMTTGSFCITVGGKGVCATGDIAALNVITKQSKVAQMQMPLLEAGDFDTASKSDAAAAAMNDFYRRAYPPSKANQCTGGEPVDLGTGYVVADAHDLELPGMVPLLWARSYSSANPAHRGALGKGGWTHSFEQWVEVSESGFVYHDAEGLPAAFGPVDETGVSFHRGRQLELRPKGRSFEIRSLGDRFVRTFSPLPSGRAALRSIREPRGYHIALEYDGDILVRIIDTAKREIRVISDDKGRVTRVEVWAREPGSTKPPSLQTFFEYGYHPEGELAHQMNALGHAESWEYDGLHRMIKATLRNGVSFYYEYDDDLGYCVRTWGDGGLHDVHIDIDFEKGETRTHATNSARRYFHKSGIVYREETFTGDWAKERILDDDELLVARRNGAGEATTYEYDERGNLITETDPAGNVIRYEYVDDLCVRRVDALGLATTYGYDQYGSLVAMAFPTGLSYRFDLDREGRLHAIYGNTGLMRKIDWDEHHNVAAETSARGAVTSYRYDALGRAVERTDALGRKTRLVSDALGNILEITRPDGTKVRATYDRLGYLASATDALGNATHVERAGTGYLAKVTQADGQVYRFRHDSDERLVQIINPRLETYEVDYDRADQVTAERTFDGRSISYRYDRAGRITRIDAPEDEWREFSYDKLGNTVEDRGEDVQISFERDERGEIIKAVCQDVTGKVVTEFKRDRFGRLIADIQNGRPVRYEYDGSGHTSARILPDGERTEYHYGEDDLFMGVAHAGRRVSVERDKLGRERARQHGDLKVEREYDAMDRLLSQKVVVPSARNGVSRTIGERRYGYDSKGRLSSVESVRGVGLSGLTVYRYDRIDQLIEATRGTVREVFEYDPAGSLTRILDDLADLGKKSPWSLARGNQLRATERARYINDGCGRRIQCIERVDGKDPREVPPGGDERITTYGWDSKDRLREVVLPDGTRVRFTYDAFGRRVRKDVLAPADVVGLFEKPGSRVEKRTVTYLWDGNVLCEEIDTSKPEADRKRIHVHEPQTFLPMLQIEAGQTFTVVTDHLGVPKELVDASGRVAWRAEHGAWGNVVSVTRDPGAAQVESPIRMLGQYADAETGLCYTRYRYFESATGRWLSPDPLGIAGGFNTQAFDGAPVQVVDPLGLACKPPRAPEFNDPKVARVIHHNDGSCTYCFKAGFRVTYDKHGYPDFTPHAMRRGGQPVIVRLRYTGSRDDDFRAADAAWGLTKADRANHTWHHVEDVRRNPDGSYSGTMILVARDPHEAATHYGGVSVYKQKSGNDYD